MVFIFSRAKRKQRSDTCFSPKAYSLLEKDLLEADILKSYTVGLQMTIS
jgi:hypothetical protein